MKLEEMVRAAVSGAVDDYWNSAVSNAGFAEGSAGTGSTAAPYYVPAEASGRHVHLSPEDVERLFGPGYELTPKRPLSQPGQYLSEERVTLIGPKGTFPNVAILGPPRGHTQVEISATDARALGLHPPVALSGDLSEAGDMLIASKDAFLMAEGSLIIAKNHLHMSPSEAAEAGLRDGDLVDIRMLTSRPLTFENVVVRSGPGHSLALHIDFDEANACGFETGCQGVIVGRRGSTASVGDGRVAANSYAPPAPQDAAPAPPTQGPVALGPGDVVLSTTFLSEVQVRDAIASGATAVVVGEKTVVSPLANDLLHKHGLTLKRL